MTILVYNTQATIQPVGSCKCRKVAAPTYLLLNEVELGRACVEHGMEVLVIRELTLQYITDVFLQVKVVVLQLELSFYHIGDSSVAMGMSPQQNVRLISH